MKKIIVAVLMMTIQSSANSQVLIDSTNMFRIEGYAGILAGSKIPTNSKTVTPFVTLREGVNLNWTPNKYVSGFGVASAEINESGSVTPFCLAGIRLKMNKKVACTFGRIGSPVTELRPMPNTGQSQFEPWTKSQILGPAFGTKISFAVTKKHSLVLGGFLRGDDPSLELGVHIPGFHVAGYYRTKSADYGGACTIAGKYINQTFVYNSTRNIGSFTLVTIPRFQGLLFYSDMGIDQSKFKLIRGEWGILKTFSLKITKGLFGFGYCHEIHNPKLYLMVNL